MVCAAAQYMTSLLSGASVFINGRTHDMEGFFSPEIIKIQNQSVDLLKQSFT